MSYLGQISHAICCGACHVRPSKPCLVPHPSLSQAHLEDMLSLVRLSNARSLRAPRPPARGYSSTSERRSAHSEWYASMLPGMVPVALLGSAVYMVSPVILVRSLAFSHVNVFTRFYVTRDCSYYRASLLMRNSLMKPESKCVGSKKRWTGCRGNVTCRHPPALPPLGGGRGRYKAIWIYGDCHFPKSTNISAIITRPMRTKQYD